MARHDMMYDGRRLPPRNSRGEFTSRGRGRGRRGDRGMDYGMDGRVIRSYPTIHPQGADYARDMNYDMARRDYGEDMRGSDYRGGDYRGRQMTDYGDMHHGGMGRGGYEPVEFMGYCQGYYGSPDQGYGRRGDYGYRRDYGYDYGDYGETLSDEELRHWEQKLMGELDEREKQMFNKDTIMQKIKQMGRSMDGFGEKELYLATIMCYTDYKEVIGANPDMALRLGYAWLSDKDTAVKGAEKLAIYKDCIVEGE